LLIYKTAARLNDSPWSQSTKLLTLRHFTIVMMMGNSRVIHPDI